MQSYGLQYNVSHVINIIVVFQNPTKVSVLSSFDLLEKLHARSLKKVANPIEFNEYRYSSMNIVDRTTNGRSKQKTNVGTLTNTGAETNSNIISFETHRIIIFVSNVLKNIEDVFELLKRISPA